MIKRVLSMVLTLCMACTLGTPVSYAATNDEESAKKEALAILRKQMYDEIIGDTDMSKPEVASKIAAIEKSADEIMGLISEMPPEGNLAREQFFSDDKYARMFRGTSYGGNDQHIEITHYFERLLALAKAYRTPGQKYYSDKDLNEKIKTTILEGLQWLHFATDKDGYGWWSPEAADHYYYNNGITKVPRHNWWHYEIGVPLQENPLFTLMWEDLTDADGNPTDDFEQYLLTQDYFTPSPSHASGGTAGANGTWIMNAVLERSILWGDPPLTEKQNNDPRYASYKGMTKLQAALSKNLSLLQIVSSGDGFYEDGSYIGHSNHAYSAGYGLYMYRDMADLMHTLEGTIYEFNQKQKDFMVFMMKNCYETTTYGINMLDTLNGRGIGGGANLSFNNAREAVRATLLIAMHTTGEDQAYAKSLFKRYALDMGAYYGSLDKYYLSLPDTLRENAREIVEDPTVKPKEDLTLSKVFPRMDQVSHFRNEYGLALSFYSKSRTANAEDAGQNKHGWHMSSGLMLLYNKDYDQYNDSYWPTVDAQRLPGITAVRDKQPGTGGMNGSNWAGGATLGNYSAAGVQLVPGGSTLNANKSYFLFDDEIVCLGAGINSTDDASVESTVENRRLSSSGDNTFTVGSTDGTSVVEPDSLGWKEALNDVSWAHLEGSVEGSDIGYYFPGGASLQAIREARTGRWSDIGFYASPTPQITRNYMTLYFDHGKNPINASYEYVLLPGKTAEQTEAAAKDSAIEVISNNKKVQSVKHQDLGITAANFWTDSSTTAGLLTSDKRAAVLMKENANDIELAVSDPTWDCAGAITLTLGMETQGLISGDDNVKVISTSPQTVIQINAQGAKGKTFYAKLEKAEGSVPVETEDAILTDFTDGEFYGSGKIDSTKHTITVTADENNPTNNVLKLSTKPGGGSGDVPDAEPYAQSFDNASIPEGWETNEKGPVGFDTSVNHSGDGASVRIPAPGKATAGIAYKKIPQSRSIIEAWMYDSTANQNEKVDAYLTAGSHSDTAVVMMGISSVKMTGDNNAYYMCGGYNNYKNSGIKRTVGWHKLTIDASDPYNVKEYIDDQLVTTITRNQPLYIEEISFTSWWGGNVPVYFDDFSIRPPQKEVEEGGGTVLASQYTPYQRTKMAFAADIYTDYAGNGNGVEVFSVGQENKRAASIIAKNGKFYVQTGAHMQEPLECKGIPLQGWHTVSAYVDCENKEVTVSIDDIKFVNQEPFIDDSLQTAGTILHSIKEAEAEILVDNVRIFPADSNLFDSSSIQAADNKGLSTITYGPVTVNKSEDTFTLKYQTAILNDGFENDLSSAWTPNPSQASRAKPTISQAFAASGSKSIEMKEICEMVQTFEEGNYIAEASIYVPSIQEAHSGIFGVQLMDGTVVKGEILLGIHYGTAGAKKYAYRLGGIGKPWITTNVDVQEGKWTKLKIDCSSGSDVKLYVDGTLVNAGRENDPLAIYKFNRVDVGNLWTDNGSSSVYMDDISISKGAGSANEYGTVLYRHANIVSTHDKRYYEMQVSTSDVQGEGYPFVLYDSAMLPAVKIGYAEGSLVAATGDGSTTPLLERCEADTWYTIGAAVDMTTKTADIYVNGALVLATVPLLSEAGDILETLGSQITQTSGDYLVKGLCSGRFVAMVYNKATNTTISQLPEAGNSIYVKLPVMKGSQEYILYVAAFDANGKLVSVSMGATTTTENDGIPYLQSKDITVGESWKTVKVFLMEKGSNRPGIYSIAV